MIDSIKKIGEEIAEPFPRSLVIGMRKAGVKTLLLMKLIFSLDEKKIKGDFVELDKSVLREYYWVGNAEGNTPQNRLTTDKLDYLTNPEKKKRSISNIVQNIEDFWRNEKTPEAVVRLQDKLQKIEKEFFGDSEKMRKVHDEAKKISSFEKGVVLYTVCVEEGGKIEELAKTKGYEEFLKRIFLNPHQALKGRCHICGEEKDVLPDPRFRGGSILKIYVTDKKGFTSGVVDEDEARVKTFAVCMDCLEDLLAGENYISLNLRVRLGGGLDVYLIPSGARLRKFDEINYIRDVFGAVQGFDGLQKFEKALDGEREYKKMHEEFMGENICLDLVFGARAQAKFNFKYNIQDVPIFRLDILRHELKQIAKKASGLLGGKEKEWDLGFRAIREILPLRTQRGEVREWKVLLELFSAMLNKMPYPKHLLLRRATMLARVHRFGTHELYSIRKPNNHDFQLVKDILKYNLLLALLDRVEGLSTEKSENVDEGIPEKVKQWFDEMGYDNKQMALFLLGYLVGEIGTEQFKKGDKKKAILGRLNYDGMPAEKVIMLANSILKSLRDYRILPENEMIYTLMMKAMQKSVKEMDDPVKNLFYILSGYAFNTYMAITKGGGVT